MKNKWVEIEASTHDGELGSLIYVTRLLGREEALGVYGGGNTSIKRTIKNLSGDAEETLYINHGQQPACMIQADGFTPLRCKPLASLIRLESLDSARLENEIACNRTMVALPVPPANTVLHAALPYRIILVSQPDALLAVANTLSGPRRLHEIYRDTVSIVSYAPSGLALARACTQAIPGDTPPQFAGIFVLHQGLITFGETARLAYEHLIDLVTRSEQYLKEHRAWKVAIPQVPPDPKQPAAEKVMRQEIVALRQAVSMAAGRPLILSIQADSDSRNFCQSGDLILLTQKGPAVAEHAVLTKRLPMIGRNVEAYRAACEQAIHEDNVEQLSQGYDFSPRIILDPRLGLCALGRTASEAALTGRIYRRTIHIILRATTLEAYHSLPVNDVVAVETSLYSGNGGTEPASEDVFAGEIALVTGGASGIGKACVMSLLARGAAVVNLDINPVVKTLLDRPDYLGLRCDLTDEAAVLDAFEAFARVFGGLDMLVLNAGIFPAGCRIESLTLEEWQRVMRINLDSNLVVLREAHALLKHSPRGGRVLVNASKNVLAPGAGAAAYSSSKAAVTQLARVAALEWGKDHIRVNQIHPDAIFDTGIWTEEVLKARAAHYGMTVQQYKTRNILGVELNSHYVGELVTEMLGPYFEKITGAQIPVDGGSDRVI